MDEEKEDWKEEQEEKEEANEKQHIISSQDTEHSVILVAAQS